MNNDHTIQSIDKVLELFASPSDTILSSDWEGKTENPGPVAQYVFNDGRALFSAGNTFSYRSSDFDSGILPYPKYDEKQENYYTLADNYYSMMFSIPSVCPDPNFSGFMLEVLSSESTDTSLRAFYDFIFIYKP
jgi:hypothetical protein